MKKVEDEVRIIRGHCIADMQKDELDRYIQQIYELFMSSGAIEWEGEVIFTKALLFDHIKRFNDDRLNHGWTSLTPANMKDIEEKLFEPYTIIPSNQIEILEKAIDITYDRMSEDIARLKIQMDSLKKHIIVLTEDHAKEVIKEKEVK